MVIAKLLLKLMFDLRVYREILTIVTRLIYEAENGSAFMRASSVISSRGRSAKVWPYAKR